MGSEYNYCKRIKWIIFTILGMALVSIPGFLLAPFTVDTFDEPYQILNAYDWKNAVYSPFSSWIAHIIGEWLNWRFLNFRYLTIFILWISMLIPGLYSLKHTSYPKFLSIATIFSTYFFLTLRTHAVMYGWDTWTILFASVIAVFLISFIREPMQYKIVLLGLLSSILTLTRLPNIIVILFILIILSLAYIKRKKDLILTLTFYIASTFLFLYIIISFLYGSLNEYTETFKANHIGAHSLKEIITPFIKGSARVLIYISLLGILYKIIKIAEEVIKNKAIFFLLFIGLSIVSLILLTPFCGINNVNICVLSLILLVLIVNLTQVSDKHKWKTFLLSGSIILITIVPVIGSNVGFSKSLNWPLIPLVFLFYNYSYINNYLKVFIGIWSAALWAYSLINMSMPSYWDPSPVKLRHKISGDTDSPIIGMITTEEKGRKIEQIIASVSPYLKEDKYNIIPLREGNNYLWEYLFLQPNNYQRHRFNNWYAFWDKVYIESVRNDIKKSQKPVLVMYMQWKNEDDLTPMLKMLEKETKCVLDVDGYSFWTTE